MAGLVAGSGAVVGLWLRRTLVLKYGYWAKDHITLVPYESTSQKPARNLKEVLLNNKHPRE